MKKPMTGILLSMILAIFANASNAPIRSYEIEDFELSNAKITDNSTASGGKTVLLLDGGSAEQTIFLKKGDYQVTVYAQGASGDEDRFSVSIGDEISNVKSYQNEDNEKVLPSYQSPMSYTQDEDGPCSVIISFNVEDNVQVDRIVFEQTSHGNFEIEGFKLSDAEITDNSTASGGKTVLLLAGGSAEKTVNLKKGVYNVTVYAQGASKSEDRFSLSIGSQISNMKSFQNENYDMVLSTMQSSIEYTQSEDGSCKVVIGYMGEDNVQVDKIVFELADTYEIEDFELSHAEITSNSSASGGTTVLLLAGGTAKKTIKLKKGVYNVSVYAQGTSDDRDAFHVSIGDQISDMRSYQNDDYGMVLATLQSPSEYTQSKDGYCEVVISYANEDGVQVDRIQFLRVE